MLVSVLTLPAYLASDGYLPASQTLGLVRMMGQSLENRLILAQHGLSEVVQADRQHDMELGNLMHKLFDQHFHLPVMPLDVDVFALGMELSDRVYARSVQLHEAITPRMAEEGKRVCEAYLGLYLPLFLPKR